MCFLSTFLHSATIWIIWYLIKNAFAAVSYLSGVGDGAFLYHFSSSIHTHTRTLHPISLELFQIP